ncbi:polymorphic toxin-type HINT domain-containing protein [Roseiconus lacunae]|uniref:polymorphic toxin-type HINT domain-containing protein n=1 Tax=Roseiconus lacunae TaxID=2605694 RepID=UPI00308E12EC|nr:polymorphic toxin-type HINT domain-containing protein [Stieleria sp. HD01]
MIRSNNLRSGTHRLLVRLGITCVFWVLVDSVAALSNDAVAEATESKADSLVQKALQSELAGDSVERFRLLDQAVEQDPENTSAQWQSGFLLHRDRWVPVRLSMLMNSADEVLQQYHQRRREQSGNLAGEVSLAKWCRQNQLDDRERMHWENVLTLAPNHAEARSKLRLRRYEGQWVPKDQVITAKRLQNQERRALHQWMPVLREWVERIEDVSADRSEAWRSIASVDDPDAIGALEIFAHRSAPSLQRHLIEVIGRIDGQTSSDALVRLSLELDAASGRNVAALELAKDPIHAFAGQYLDRLEAPLKYRSSLSRIGDTVFSETLIRQERADDVVTFTRATKAGMSINAPVIRTSRVYHQIFANELAFQTRRIAETEQSIENQNEDRASSNERIFAALKTSTGEQFDDQPQLWWDWWKRYNEYDVTASKRHVHLSQTDYRRGELRIPLPPRCECFPAGTIVHTEIGRRPIESIRSGDKVLSKDPISGELSYRLVTRTTARPPSDTMRLMVAGESITATVGHPFWVTGKGWTMAKELNPGDRLHGLHGSVPIEVVEGGAACEAFNLVVEKTNTYFVGESALLVHDNMIRSSSQQPIPGWHSN